MSGAEEPLGITDEDRKRLGEIAAKNQKQRTPNPNAGNYPPDHPTVKWARIQVAFLHETDGAEYIKAKWLAEDSEFSTRGLGRALGTLREEGLLEIDGASCASRRYRITMGGPE